MRDQRLAPCSRDRQVPPVAPDWLPELGRAWARWDSQGRLPGGDELWLDVLFCFKDFIYLFMRQREREREAETQAEGEAGSLQEA